MSINSRLLYFILLLFFLPRPITRFIFSFCFSVFFHLLTCESERWEMLLFISNYFASLNYQFYFDFVFIYCKLQEMMLFDYLPFLQNNFFSSCIQTFLRTKRFNQLKFYSEHDKRPDWTELVWFRVICAGKKESWEIFLVILISYSFAEKRGAWNEW